MNDDLCAQIERLRLEMTAEPPRLATSLMHVEQHILAERDATLRHIQHIAHMKQESERLIRTELEALRLVLVPQAAAMPPPPAPQIPAIEERFTAPRFMREAAE